MPDTCPPPSLWSIRDAAAHLAVSERTIHDHIKRGRIRTVLIGRRRLVPATEVLRIAEHGTTPQQTTSVATAS
jgi:excisionase family DNA binding protein